MHAPRMNSRLRTCDFNGAEHVRWRVHVHGRECDCMCVWDRVWSREGVHIFLCVYACVYVNASECDVR